jgi:50S ribosomal protein L16 3-hydroxylase
VIGFGDWFAPVGLAEFAQRELGQRPHRMPPRIEVAQRMMQALGIRSVDDVFALRDPKVFTWSQHAEGREAGQIDPGAAAASYLEGATLYFRDIAEFAEPERAVASELGLPDSQVRFELFCSRKGAVSSVHFDAVDVIAIQLSGRKTWRLAPNDFARRPLENWNPTEPVSPAMRAYAQGVPPQEMPADAVTHDLEPGSVLHIPRGYWHDTSSDEDSLSVHVMLLPPTRLDNLLLVLRNELVRDERWREAAYDVSGQRLAEDFATLREVASRLDPRDVLPVPADGVDGRFVRSGQTSIGVEDVDRDTVRVAITAYGLRETRTASIDLSSSFLPACRWVGDLATGTAFGIADLQHAAPELSTEEAQALASTLERTRLVRAG